MKKGLPNSDTMKRVLNALQMGNMTQPQIIERTRLERKQVENALRNLIKIGDIEPIYGEPRKTVYRYVQKELLVVPQTWFPQPAANPNFWLTA